MPPKKEADMELYAAIDLHVNNSVLVVTARCGKFASYARMVDSRRESNGKSKGVGNRKCGNKHLSWAFIEAAHCAVRYDPSVRRFYQRKCAKGLSVVAIKAVAHKLARACYH